jgi:hypothetical protein
MNRCSTPNCSRQPNYPDIRFCGECLAVVLRTGRPPELAVKWEPEWKKKLRAKDLTGWAA